MNILTKISNCGRVCQREMGVILSCQLLCCISALIFKSCVYVGHLATLNGVLIALEAPVVSNDAGTDANVEFL